VTVCSDYLTEFSKNKQLGTLGRSFESRVSDKVTVVIGTFNRATMALNLANHVLKSPLVRDVVIVWHNPRTTPPPNTKGVTYVRESFDSLNNRFNPTTLIKTTHVLMIDDDMMADLDDIEFLITIALKNPDQITGAFARYAEKLEDGSHIYHTDKKEINLPDGKGKIRPYNMILTKFMILHVKYFFSYTCLLPPQAHEYVDDRMNCEDIGMNLMVQGMTGLPPIHVDITLKDYGTDVGSKGISMKNNHLSLRSECVDDLMTILETQQLVESASSYVKYEKNHYTKEAVLIENTEIKSV